jgi:hypothetical protein
VGKIDLQGDDGTEKAIPDAIRASIGAAGYYASVLAYDDADGKGPPVGLIRVSNKSVVAVPIVAGKTFECYVIDSYDKKNVENASAIDKITQTLSFVPHSTGLKLTSPRTNYEDYMRLNPKQKDEEDIYAIYFEPEDRKERQAQVDPLLQLHRQKARKETFPETLNLYRAVNTNGFTFDAQIKWKVLEVSGDGHCFFHSVIKSIADKQTQYQNMGRRSAAINEAVRLIGEKTVARYKGDYKGEPNDIVSLRQLAMTVLDNDSNAMTRSVGGWSDAEQNIPTSHWAEDEEIAATSTALGVAIAVLAITKDHNDYVWTVFDPFLGQARDIQIASEVIYIQNLQIHKPKGKSEPGGVHFDAIGYNCAYVHELNMSPSFGSVRYSDRGNTSRKKRSAAPVHVPVKRSVSFGAYVAHAAKVHGARPYAGHMARYRS